MFSQNDDDYRTCKHESYHCLRALACGQRVLKIDIPGGITFLMWSAFPYELPRLLRTDPLYAERLVRAVVSTCLAPGIAERQPANPTDQAAYEPFLRSWPRSAPITRDTLYRQACAETRAWLAEPETRRRVLKLSERLFVFRREVLEGEYLERVLAPFTAPPVAAHVHPTPAAGAARSTKAERDLQNVITFYAVPGSAPAPTPERSVSYAPTQRQNRHLYCAA
jgi:hypothetical protein